MEAAPSIDGAVTAYVREQVAQGLAAAQLAPVGSGYVQALLGYSGQEGVFGRAELGWHPAQDLSLFGYGEASTRLGVSAGLGARLTW